MKSINLNILSEYRSSLMGIATIMILCCHCPHWCNQLPGMLKSILVMGYLGVDMFLFLSGIGMFYSYNKRKSVRDKRLVQYILNWYARRYKRILIPYLIIAIPCYLIVTVQENETFAMFACNVSTLSYWLYHKGAWYVAMLLPLYLITPLLLFLLSGKYKWLRFAILSVLCLSSTFIVPNDSAGEIIYNIVFVVRRLPSYFLGIVIAKEVKGNKSLSLKTLLIITSSCLIIAGIFYHYGLAFEMFAIIPIITVSCLVLHINTTFFISFNRASASLGQVSLESYIFNILLPLILTNIDWNSIYQGINSGNYMMYALTITLGISLSYLSSYFTDNFILKKQAVCNIAS